MTSLIFLSLTLHYENQVQATLQVTLETILCTSCDVKELQNMLILAILMCSFMQKEEEGKMAI